VEMTANTQSLERQMRKLRPTGSNTEELRNMFSVTRDERRQYISQKNPDATTIITRWPRLFDVNELVCMVYTYQTLTLQSSISCYFVLCVICVSSNSLDDFTVFCQVMSIV